MSAPRKLNATSSTTIAGRDPTVKERRDVTGAAGYVLRRVGSGGDKSSARRRGRPRGARRRWDRGGCRGRGGGVLAVVDPRSTGIGGDLFAQCWPVGSQGPVGLASAGVAPAAMTTDALRAAGHTAMPVNGAWTVTVPGAPAGWEALLERFGRLGAERILAPAISHAAHGFPVSRFVAEEWRSSEAKLRASPAAARELFLPGGEVPVAGQALTFPDLARSLDAFASYGAAPFYRGEIARRLAAAVQDEAGPLQASDLAEWAGPEWVSPISTSYRGTVGPEMPPPGHGVVVLETLRIMEGSSTPDAVGEDHALIESLKFAFADACATVADPSVEPVAIERLLSDEHVASRRAGMLMEQAAEAVIGRPS
ncbi:MAG: gamma-glutamyltransferase family protein, partial [Chloroflexota bacterium]|nr:gamma-glutamyltransferase family protein [Chloroflexota bacterium]